GVPQFVDAGLDGEHSRERHVDELEKPSFQFALYLDTAISLLDLHDDRRMRPAEQLGEHNASLRVSVIIGLQASKNQIELLFFDSSGESLRGIEGIESDKRVVLEMNSAIGALGQCLAENLLRTRWPGGDHDHLAAVLLLLAQSLLERVGIGLINFVGDV